MKWQNVINELQDMGMTENEIASEIGVTQTAVSYLRVGRNKEPRYGTGVRLLRLHQRVTCPECRD